MNKAQKLIFLLEKDWQPEIGWWEDADPLIMYHGTHQDNLDNIMKNGLTKKDVKTGMISLAFDPNTALGYAAMSGVGGEFSFRKAGAKVKSTPISERVVIKFNLPQKWVKTHMDKNLGGNLELQRERLKNKLEYEKFSKPDYVYYELCELRFNTIIPAEFISGIIRK
jgi:hypothetical protein